MAEDFDMDPNETPDGADEGTSSRTRPVLAAVVGIVCLLAGGAVGMTALGSTVAPILADRAEASGGHEGGEGGEGGEGAAPVALHVIDNLVVNPARSRGTRFLLTSIAVEVADPTLTEAVAAQDVALRASLLVVLGAHTVDELTDIERRPEIAEEIRQAITAITGPDVVHEIFIPQFVIQ